jgi:hypothetical protein
VLRLLSRKYPIDGGSDHTCSPSDQIAAFRKEHKNMRMSTTKFNMAFNIFPQIYIINVSVIVYQADIASRAREHQVIWREATLEYKFVAALLKTRPRKWPM